MGGGVLRDLTFLSRVCLEQELNNLLLTARANLRGSCSFLLLNTRTSFSFKKSKTRSPNLTRLIYITNGSLIYV